MGIRVTGKRLRRACCGLLVCFSPALHALGLGDAHVHSFLGQPLKVRIALISQSEEELATISAGLASAEDFRIVGLNRAALSVPLKFDVSPLLPEPHIRVTSVLPVSDPVVQFVVEVTFPNGRMLRQYTLFLDPPTFAAPVPPPSISPRQREASATGEPPRPAPAAVLEADTAGTLPPATAPATTLEDPGGDDARLNPGEPAAQPAATAAPEASPEEAVADGAAGGEVPPGPEAGAEATPSAATAIAPESEGDAGQAAVPAEEEEEPAQSREADEPAESAAAASPAPGPETQAEQQPAATPEPEPEPALRPEPGDNTRPDPAPVVYREPAESGLEYGPVASGETMWAIASRFVERTGYDINQAMLAIQRRNPEAFINNNINALRRGVILRMPTLEQVGAMSSRAAMLEAMRQEEEYRARREGRTVEAPPLVAQAALETPDAQDAMNDTPPGPDESRIVGRLELVPPTEQGAGAGRGGPDDEGAGSRPGDSAEQALARAEEELANARQENEYLSARIRELETRLAATQGAVRDTGLAEMESSLRDQRLSDAPDAPVAVVPRPEEPALSSGSAWWITALVAVLVAALVWFLHRFRATRRSRAKAVSSIKSEAEEVLRVLEPEAGDSAAGKDNVIDRDRYAEPGPDEPGPGGATAPETAAGPAALPGFQPEHGATESEDATDGTAAEPDADDPETKLDLARAYISVGDREAARVILEEVIKEGDEQQVAEARNMMTEI